MAIDSAVILYTPMSHLRKVLILLFHRTPLLPRAPLSPGGPTVSVWSQHGTEAAPNLGGVSLRSRCAKRCVLGFFSGKKLPCLRHLFPKRSVTPRPRNCGGSRCDLLTGPQPSSPRLSHPQCAGGTSEPRGALGTCPTGGERPVGVGRVTAHLYGPSPLPRGTRPARLSARGLVL